MVSKRSAPNHKKIFALSCDVYLFMIYLHIMVKLLKIIFLLILIFALALVFLYIFYKDDLLEKGRVYFMAQVSAALEKPVDIGSLKYVPLQSISLDNVIIREGKFTPKDSEESSVALETPLKEEPLKVLAEMDNITITFDVFSIIKNKQLKTTISIDGLRTQETLSNALLSTTSRNAETYKEVFDLSLVESIFIIEADVAAESFSLTKIVGPLEVDDLTVPSGKIGFTYNTRKYLVDFITHKDKENTYDVSLRSDNLAFKSTFTKDESDLILGSVNGMFYNVHFDFKGTVKNIYTPEAFYSFSGIAETNLRSFPTLPGKIGKVFQGHALSGSLQSLIRFETRELDLAKCEATATFTASNLRIDNLIIREIASKVSLKDGRISAPLINGNVYEGTLLGRLNIDVIEKGFPFMLSMVVKNMNYGKFLRDATSSNTDIYGTLDAEVSLEGYMKDIDTTKGYGTVMVSNADLGPMPILAPLLGDMLSNIQNTLLTKTRVTINQAYMDFEIKNRRITTNNLTFVGESIYVSSEGYMDFDGNLNFTFQNKFREIIPETEEEDDWQIMLRNTIVRFGKLISKARLRGTIKDPKWDFEYLNPLNNLIKINN